VDQKIIMCHTGRPCDPPIINMPHGDPIVFEPNPNGGPLWIAYCTAEQVEDMARFDFFRKFTEELPEEKIEKGNIPDETWTRAGIAEWALEELDIVIDLKLKADMLAELNAAVAKAEAEKASLPPFVSGEPVTD